MPRPQWQLGGAVWSLTHNPLPEVITLQLLEMSSPFVSTYKKVKKNACTLRHLKKTWLLDSLCHGRFIPLPYFVLKFHHKLFWKNGLLNCQLNRELWESCFCTWELTILNCSFTWQIKSWKVSICHLNCKTSFLPRGHAKTKSPTSLCIAESLTVCISKDHQYKPEHCSVHLLSFTTKNCAGNRDMVSDLRHFKTPF